MCGIWGIVYGPEGPLGEEWSPTDAAQLMFSDIVHRGPHAFGWMSYNPESGISIYKQPGKVTDHMSKVQVDDDCRWIVGHVRWATNGKPEYNGNNHPLVHGKVVGVHNGVLSGWQKIIEETGREDNKAEVDSEAIFAAVSKWGIRDGLKRIDGNMVTVFTETSHPEVLHIARSHSRPLVYGFTKAGSMVFASEIGVLEGLGWDLHDIVDMTGARYRHLTVKEGKITGREQYRTAAATVAQPVRPAGGTNPFRRVPTPLEVEQGATRGLTDYFDRTKNRGKKGKDGRGTVRRPTTPPSPVSSGRTSLDPAPPLGTAPGLRDEWGGEYIGAGWYRAANGKIMTIEDYIKWQVENELARREHQAEADAAADFQSILEADEQELAEQYLAAVERDGGLQ